jgi:hypothetical protein
MDSLGGTSKALMFACCSPASAYLEVGPFLDRQAESSRQGCSSPETMEA